MVSQVNRETALKGISAKQAPFSNLKAEATVTMGEIAKFNRLEEWEKWKAAKTWITSTVYNLRLLVDTALSATISRETDVK